VLLSSIRRGDDPDEASLAAVRQAHEAMAILGTPSRAPSATYISAVIGPDAVTICWLGDSRAYWLATDSDAKRLTRDDSLAEEMVAQGELTEAEAMASPQAHVITRWLGADVGTAQPHVTRFEPSGRGVVLISSDGLWNYRPDATGLAGLALPAAFHDPSSAADALLKFALDAGGMDNITIVLVPFPLARPAPLPRRIRHDRLRLHRRRRPEPVPARGRPRRERRGHRDVRGGRRRRGSVGRRGQRGDHHHRLLRVDGLSADQDDPGAGRHRRRDRRGA